MSQERFDLERVTTQEEAPLAPPGYTPYPDAYAYGHYGDDDRQVRNLWRTVRKRKFLILLVALVVTTVVTIEVYRTKSTYRASALVEVGKDNSAMMAAGGVLLQDDSDTTVPQVAMKTKMLVLKSRPLLEEVVLRLKLDQKPAFLDVAQKRSIMGAIHSVFGGEGEAPPAGELDAQAAEEAPAGAESPEQQRRLAPFVKVLSANLAVEQVKETRALKISFTHTDPALAQSVANGVAQVFIENNFRKKTEKFTNTSEWLDRSTRELKARVEKAEQQLADYTRQNNIFSTEGKETLTTDKLTRLHDQATRAETERILKQSLYEEVKAGRADKLPEAFADARVAELQKRLGELSVQAAQLDVKYGPENPRVVEVRQQMKALEEQIAASRKGLEEKLRADYERAVREEQSLKAAFERAKGEAVQQNQAAIQYNILQQEVATAKQLYTDFLQKSNQAQVQLAEQQNNLRLIEPAERPESPVGPMRLRTILIGLFLSLAAGVGLAFFLEYLDNTIKTVEDVSRYAQLPALSVIPAISAGNAKRLNAGRKGLASGAAQPGALAQPGTLAALDSRSSAAEAYRVLRTSVLLSSAGNPPKTILVTSGQAGEGKTTTAVNTAISLAQLGASVLVIDCDLRKPSVHKALGINFAQGVSTYLSRKVEIDGLIQKVQIPNLSVLPCGPIPPNPAELISSERMKQMLRQLGERYEHIIIDSPPLMNVTDPVILSTMVDGVILVVHGGKSTRDIVRRARQELANVGAKIFGVVLNNVDLRREGYEVYYYGSYGEEQSEARS